MSAFNTAFGERLIVARFNYGRISQEALAERAEIQRTQVSLIEAGHRSMRLETFVKLVGALDLTPDELLGPIRWRPGVRKYGSFDLGEEEA